MSEIEDLNRLENTMRREWRAWYEKCAALEAEIERLKSEMLYIPILPKWIPVSERLPENRKQILVFIDGIPDYEGNSLSRITESYYDEKFVCWLGEYVTHWMPLPPPPEDE